MGRIVYPYVLAWHARVQLATYPQMPFSGVTRWCDVPDPPRAFSWRVTPGRLWISLNAVLAARFPQKN
jgi:hypothetical protein